MGIASPSRLYMDSDSLGSEAVPDEKTAIPKIEPCAAVDPAPLQQEPIDQEGLEDDETWRSSGWLYMPLWVSI